MLKVNDRHCFGQRQFLSAPGRTDPMQPIFDYTGLQFHTRYHMDQMYIQQSQRLQNSPSFKPLSTSTVGPLSAVAPAALFDFQRHMPVDIQPGHFQLHDCLKLVGADTLAVPCFGSLKAVNVVTGSTHTLAPTRPMFSFDISADHRLATWVEKTNDYSDACTRVCLYDLKRKCSVLTKPIYDIDNIIGRSLFVEFCGPKVMVTGNALYAGLYDLGKGLAESKIRTGVDINNQAYSEKNRLAAFALDDGTICLADLRTENPSITFQAHQGYALAVSFLGDEGLVTGGQDGCVKIFDLRYGSPVFETGPSKFIPVAARGSEDGQSLAVAYMAFSVAIFKAAGGGWLRDELPIFGQIGGIDMTPDGKDLYVSTWSLQSNNGILHVALTPDGKVRAN